nr:MAG TPA: hypothetical protein [Caudoviricetes sp.]
MLLILKVIRFKKVLPSCKVLVARAQNPRL